MDGHTRSTKLRRDTALTSQESRSFLKRPPNQRTCKKYEGPVSTQHARKSLLDSSERVKPDPTDKTEPISEGTNHERVDGPMNERTKDRRDDERHESQACGGQGRQGQEASHKMQRREVGGALFGCGRRAKSQRATREARRAKTGGE